MNAQTSDFTLVDLFAGCGALSLGLEQAGFRPIYVNEINSDALATYLVNRMETNEKLKHEFHSRDIKDLVTVRGALEHVKKLFNVEFGVNVENGDLDLLVGGPPCQGYSAIGHRRSYTVDRECLPSNHLFQDMVQVIEQLKPKLFLFENVKGLLYARWNKKGQKGEIWKSVLQSFQNIEDYKIAWSLVHAKEYGIPQNRPRILLVGIRTDLIDKGLRFGGDAVDIGLLPEPSGRAPNIEDVLSDLVDPQYVNGGETVVYPSPPTTIDQEELRQPPPWSNDRQQNASLTDHKYSKHGPQIVAKFAHMIETGGTIPTDQITNKFAQRVLPAQWDERGPTITATSMPDDYVHYCQPRTLTVREWARLQTFPDWYLFEGKRTTGGLRRAGNPQAGLFDRELPKYTQIGNGVPVRLAYAVGKHFVNLLSR